MILPFGPFFCRIWNRNQIFFACRQCAGVSVINVMNHRPIVKKTIAYRTETFLFFTQVLNYKWVAYAFA